MEKGVTKLVTDLSQAKRTYIANQIKNLSKGYAEDGIKKSEKNNKQLVQELLDKREIAIRHFDLMKVWNGERWHSDCFGLEDFFSKSDLKKIDDAISKVAEEAENSLKAILELFYLELRQLPIEIMTSSTLTVEQLEKRIAVLQTVLKTKFRKSTY
jgi:hypothetical protein